MKRTGRILALVLALAMLFSVTVFADWTVYGGNNNHNSVVTEAPTSTSPTVKEINLLNSGSGWDGVDNVPVMRTINGVTYAYVLYDGHAAGGRLAKINCNDGVIVWDKQVTGASGFQLSTPLLVPGADDGTGDTIYLAASYAETYSDASFTGSETIAAGSTGVTKTFNISNITTSSNRVAAGIYLGETTVANRGTIGVTGTAQITCGSANVTLNLIASGTNSGTNVVMYEQPIYTGEEITSYKYYYYVNYNINVGSANVGTAQTLTLTIKLTGGDGTLQYVDTYAQVAALQKVTGIETNDAGAAGVEHPSIVSGITGQINTPVTKYGNYVYFGTWSGNTSQPYYQVNITDNTYKTFTPDTTYKSGFYWAGAVSDGTNVYFGGDNGKLYWRSINAFDTTGGYYDLKLEESEAGNVRSSIMLDDGYLYFTSQGGFVWCCLFDPGSNQLAVEWSLDIGVKSTSTPTKVGNRLYVGVYPGFNNGALFCVNTLTQEFTQVIPYNASVNNQMPIQSSIVVKGDGTGTDYLYFNTNSGSGAGVCYKFDGTTGTQVWATDADTYALGGMAIDNGYAVFGNDYNHLYVVHDPA